MADVAMSTPEQGGDKLLIVFTDEVGSTIKDEKEYKSVNAQDPQAAKGYKDALVSRRCAQFGKLVSNLIPTGSRIVKNVGDALIITLRTKDGDANLEFCLKALFQAWKSLGDEIRIAVHLAPIATVATDIDRSEFVSLIQRNALNVDKAEIETLWPALAVIGSDVFGAPMNRAARLAGVPRDAQFVVSEQVVTALVNDPELTESQRLTQGQKRLDTILNATSDRVPLVNVKNVKSVSLDDPWMIMEIRQLSTPPVLIKQFKSVQAIRVIEVAADVVNDKVISSATSALHEEIVSPSTCTSFFADLLFSVNEAWAGCSIQRDRRFNKYEKLIFSKRDTFPNKTKAMCVVFSGCPDLATDEELRKRFAKKEQNGNWTLRPITMRIYEQAHYYCESPDNDLPNGGGYVLIEFQVNSGVFGTSPDSREVFSPLGKDYMFGGLKTIAYGLLEGETDGFVLFRTSETNDKVKEFFEMSHGMPGIGQKGFFDQVALNTLYFLNLIHKNKQEHLWTALRSYEKPK